MVTNDKCFPLNSSIFNTNTITTIEFNHDLDNEVDVCSSTSPVLSSFCHSYCNSINKDNLNEHLHLVSTPPLNQTNNQLLATNSHKCPGENCAVCFGALRDSRGLHNIYNSNIVYADSACSRPLMLPRSQSHHAQNLTGIGGQCAKTASGERICSTDSGIFPIGSTILPVDVYEDHDLKQGIIGLGSLANLGYDIHLNQHNIHVSKDGVDFIESPKDTSSTLWPINLDSLVKGQDLVMSVPYSVEDDNHTVNLTIKHSSHADFAKFVSAAMGYQPDSTILKAMRQGRFIWPHFTPSMLANNPTHLMTTHVGHLDAIPSYIQSSTKSSRNKKRKEEKERIKKLEELAAQQLISPPIDINSPTIEDDPIMPTIDEEDDVNDDQCLYTKIVPFDDLNTEIQAKIVAHADAAGRFPFQSQSRNNYVLITVFKNYIRYTPFQSRSAEDYNTAFSSVLTFFKLHGQKLHIIRMDNEAAQQSSLLKAAFVSADVTVEYVAPGDHRTLLAERAIRTAKNHVISILAGADKLYPQSLWDESLEYAELTLNALRPFHNDINISAFQGIFGHTYNVSRHPLCVFGTKALAFNPPNERGSWSHHGTPVFYLGPVMDGYRTHRCYDITTRKKSNSNNCAFYHDKLLLPGSSLGDRLHASISDLNETIRQINVQHLIREDKQDLFRTTSSSLMDNIKALSEIFIMPPRNLSAEAIAPIVDPQASQVQRVVVPPQVDEVQRVALNAPQLAQHHHHHDHLAAIPQVPPGFEPLQQANQYEPVAQRTRSRTHNSLTNFIDEDDFPVRSVIECERVISNDTGDECCVVKRVDVPHNQDINDLPISAGPPKDRLNLDDFGNPLTYNTAMADPDRHDRFLAAGETEWTKFLDKYKCLEGVLFQDIPTDRRADITYLSHQVKEKFQMVTEEYQARVRICAGGDKTHYDGDRSSHVAAMPAIKILLNSVVSTPGAKFATIDIVDFYLMHPLDRPEYVKIAANKIPQNILNRYHLHQFVDPKDFIYFKCNRTLWGLPQAGLISNKSLVKVLTNAGYVECPHTLGLMTHNTRSTAFSLVVDDFGIKYLHQDDLDHLESTIRNAGYDLRINVKGDKYLGYKITHDTHKKEIILDMETYVKKGLNRFCPHGTPPHANSAVLCSALKFDKQGPIVEEHHDEDDFEAASQEQKQFVQEVIGYFSYYAIAQDCTRRYACNIISQQQAHPTQRTLKQVDRMLGYIAAHPDNKLVFRASDMQLKFQCDGSHNSQPGAKGIAASYYYMGDEDDPLRLNGAIDVLCKVIPIVTGSAGETEYCTLFMAGQRSCPHIATLNDLGHKQLATTAIIDNDFAFGICNDKIKEKRSKSIDLRIHWMRDRVRQGQFNIIWKKGITNVADFFTKPQPAYKHKEFMRLFMRVPTPKNGAVKGSPKQIARSQAWRDQHSQKTANY